MRKIAIRVSALLVSFLPALAVAAGPAAGFGGVGDLVKTFIDFINGYLVPAVFALAFFMFLWGMFKFFFLSGASEEGREAGKQLMLWAVIAFVMMVSIWGLVEVVAGGFGFNDPTPPVLPKVPTGA